MRTTLLLSVLIHALSAVLVASQSCSSSTPCPVGSCCSIYGYCGTTSAYCAPGNCGANCWTGCQLGGANSCPSNQCCSQYGYCGTTVDHCSPANRCFSNCNAGVATPAPTTPPAPPSGRVFVGYVASWLTGRTAPCNLDLSKVNAMKYTHINVAFAKFTTAYQVMPDNGDTSAWYTQVQNLKSRNSKLKVLISIGGGAFGTALWVSMLASSSSRTTFINSAIAFARSNNFDGIDIDYEFPESAQTAQLQSLFSSLRSAIATDAASRGKPALLLTVAAPNWGGAINAFGFNNIHQYLDWINVMTYDYYGTWSSVIGSQTAFDGPNSIKNTMSYFTAVPASKVVLGFANYARTFKLTNTANTAPGSAFSGGGAAGSCTYDSGTYNYYEVNQFISTHPTGKSVWDSVAQTPYFYSGTQWITYDNQASLLVKTNYLKSQGYRGAMVWAMDADTTLTDFVATQIGL